MFNCDLQLKNEACVVLVHKSKSKNCKNQMCTSIVITRKKMCEDIYLKNKNCQGPTEDQHRYFLITCICIVYK